MFKTGSSDPVSHGFGQLFGTRNEDYGGKPVIAGTQNGGGNLRRAAGF